MIQPTTVAKSSTDSRDQSSVVDKSAHKQHLQAAQETLVAEFHTLVGDTERLLKHTADIAGVQADELRAKVAANLARAKDILKSSELSLEEQSRAAIQATEEYVNTHPWQAIGVAAGVGFLLGLLTSRR